MKYIEVEKNKLIDIIKVNKANHIKKFEETYEGYLDDIEVWLRKQLDNLLHKPDEKLETRFPGQEPDSHEDDYDRILGMLEIDVDSTVSIDAQEYEQYIRDNWSWTRSFSHLNDTYSKV